MGPEEESSYFLSDRLDRLGHMDASLAVAVNEKSDNNGCEWEGGGCNHDSGQQHKKDPPTHTYIHSSDEPAQTYREGCERKVRLVPSPSVCGR